MGEMCAAAQGRARQARGRRTCACSTPQPAALPRPRAVLVHTHLAPVLKVLKHGVQLVVGVALQVAAQQGRAGQGGQGARCEALEAAVVERPAAAARGVPSAALPYARLPNRPPSFPLTGTS